MSRRGNPEIPDIGKTTASFPKKITRGLPNFIDFSTWDYIVFLTILLINGMSATQIIDKTTPF